MTKRKQQPDEDPTEEVIRLLNELNLTAAPLVLADLLRQAEREACSYTELLARLLRHEWEKRRERRVGRALKRSKLGVVEGLDGYDFSCRPKLEARVVRELLNCRWVEERRNLICVGRPGTGKTRLLKAIGRAACLRGYNVLYTVTEAMLDDLHAAEADGTQRRTFRRYVKPAVLILDELGYQRLNADATSHLFRLVSARHEKAATLIAANTGFRGWKRFFPSEAQAVATVDRLIDRATILRFTGKSFRKPKDIYGAELDPDDD